MEDEVFYQLTGNPFVDAGIWAICGWVEKENPEDLTKDDLKKITKDIVPLYLTQEWSKNLFSIFPNNPVTNPSIKNKEEKLRQIYSDLIDQLEPVNESGNCISCGRREVSDIRTKSEIPLIGSGKLINFFPNGQPGGDYCPSCTLAVQFSPLALYSCVNFLLLQTNSGKVMHYWCKSSIQDIRSQILTRNYTGCFNEDYKNPVNALFHIIEDIILRYEERWVEENPSITLYHFTNYNQNPDLNIYRVPNSVFRFLADVKNEPEWKTKIVRRGYNWNKIKDKENYKNRWNGVYSNLLNGKSIVGYFINRRNKQSYGGWNLLEYYLMEVRNMDSKRLETLKKVGDALSEYIKETQNIKRLTQLETASNFATFRNLLRLIEKERIKNASIDPIFTLEDFMTGLFPEGNLGWKETQDLLLFRIYENLHNWLIEQDELREEISVEEEKLEE
ncbi:type I-B CRISPR-associated protein Cas8b1/Cst1 [Methanococcoides methylutens]|uniref:CRISPR-associated protein, Cst1 family n=1 Tax=Methanococcoides methylutens MM1 TaxID=1434104 RepID=A0A0E3SRZ2_METMT|nr:type I-B CRISPR-associated protein Cas8b1/Cst1 [Methanococcoides methylutens]AKB85836.1 CRISPR-associated protein, Cst1 family [Methanococcoides methylutens MM1]